ncbi:MAG TPA: GAF domain-containing protein [Gaiellaceae bacterium]|nr:GAF domain-containing protein [Gaiellaceae bacterium]
MDDRTEVERITARVAQLELTMLEVVTALGMLVGELALRDDLVLTTPGAVEEALEHGWQTLIGVPSPQDADLIVADAHWADRERLAEAAPGTLRRAMDDTGASVGAVYAIEHDHALLVAHYGYPVGVMEAFETFGLDADLPVATAARTRRPLWFGDRDAIVESYPHLRDAHEATEVELGKRAVQGAVVPLVAGDGVAAVVILGFTTDRASQDASRLHALRQRIVAALETR